MAELFDQLRTAAEKLSLQFDQLQRVRRLMSACQIHSIPAGNRRIEWQPSGLIITGARDEGVLVVLDHREQGIEPPRTCRTCGCTDIHACMTANGPCSWRALYGDGTGLCSACDDNQAQASLFPRQLTG